jgi:hypothetical protein
VTLLNNLFQELLHKDFSHKVLTTTNSGEAEFSMCCLHHQYIISFGVQCIKVYGII